MQIIASIVMILGGLVLYKLLIDYTSSASWPGLIICGLGLLYLAVLLATQKSLKANKGVRIGALILGFGTVASLLVPIVFSEDKFGGFAYLFTVPFVIIGIVVIIFSALATTARNWKVRK